MKTKIGIIINPDVAKKVLGWDKDECDRDSNESVGKYDKYSTEDISVFWSTDVGVAPFVFFYTPTHSFQIKDGSEEIYKPYLYNKEEIK